MNLQLKINGLQDTNIFSEPEILSGRSQSIYYNDLKFF